MKYVENMYPDFWKKENLWNIRELKAFNFQQKDSKRKKREFFQPKEHGKSWFPSGIYRCNLPNSTETITVNIVLKWLIYLKHWMKHFFSSFQREQSSVSICYEQYQLRHKTISFKLSVQKALKIFKFTTITEEDFNII